MSSESATSGLSSAVLPKQALDGSPVYTVSELTREIREVLEHKLGLVWVTGEISNIRKPGSGHYYFTLKDDFAQLAVVMWRTTASALRFELKDGQSIVLQGELCVYEPRGQYQIVVRRVEPLGIGALQLAFMQLKEKLAKEGLFDPLRKKPLPFFPRRIAIVTSPTSAAIQDMFCVILRRFPAAKIIVCPVRVQGNEAAEEIARAVRDVNELPDVDVMIVGRGGGSLEDLWAFNEEVVARAIAASQIPIISAVGHETDFSIADFVADMRALTPTDAANVVVPDVRELTDLLHGLGGRLGKSLLNRLAGVREHLLVVEHSYAMRKPLERIRAREQQLDDLALQLYRGIGEVMQIRRHRTDVAAGRLESLSPLAVLRRGYSITVLEATGKVLRDTAGLRHDVLVSTRLANGKFMSRVVRDAGTNVNLKRGRAEQSGTVTPSRKRGK